MKRVAIIGSTGQLGTDVVQILRHVEEYDVVPLGHEQIECTHPDSVHRALLPIDPDIVINCAAYVQVDESEEQPEAAFQVNALGALHVARSCAALGAQCVYISTDYVFDGEKGSAYTENDPPCPINVYGTSKLAGEHLVQQAGADWLIVRVASLYGKTGARGKGGNFIEAILARASSGAPLRVVNDMWMSPTYTVDAAHALIDLIQHHATGLYHVTNRGRCTWFDFACQAVHLVGLDTDVEPIPAADYPTRARRPQDASLRSVYVTDQLRHPLRPWQDALQAYLVEKGHVKGPTR